MIASLRNSLFIFVLTFFCLSNSPASAQQPVFPTYSSMVDALQGLEPDETKVATISGFFLQRESASFSLEEGTITLCKPIGGKVRAAVFTGKATFSFTPPTKVEREQLERQLGVQIIEDEVESVLIIFADSTEQELKSGCTFTKQTPPSSAKSIIKNGISGIVSKESGFVDLDLTKTILEEKDNSLFFAIMDTKKYGELMWSFNPYAEEQVQLSKRRSVSMIHSSFFEPINQYQAESEISSENFQKGDLEINNYIIDCTIGKDLEFAVSTTVRGILFAESAHWLYFYISKYIQVSSVSMNGVELDFYAGKEGGGCWVNLVQKFNRGDGISLKFECSSKNIMTRLYDWTFLESSIGWYPHSGYIKYAFFDATFHIPKRYTFVAVGDNVSKTEVDEVVTTRWVTPTKIRNYSFNIGVFSTKKFDDKELPDFSIHSLNTDQRENVMQDIGLSFKFYQKIYGNLDIKHFDATEISSLHGEAFPGMLHLSYATFLDAENSGGQEVFCAHEVAHQWWGIGVDFQSYHDQWLSEAFSEYSALMYMQATLNNEKFFKMLKKYREKIVDKRKSMSGSRMTQSGPISLGRRTITSISPEDYDLVVYKKGAWVLHMLRHMFLDVKTMKEDAFFKIMKTFFETYKGKQATTKDFRNVIEQYVGNDVGWFFDQWVDGTEIPLYKFAYKVVEQDGKFKVTCQVYQTNVSPEFRMSIPIKVDFGNNRVIRVRAMITGQKAVFDLPLMPLMPEDVILNDLESVLCEVETMDFIE